MSVANGLLTLSCPIVELWNRGMWYNPEVMNHVVINLLMFIYYNLLCRPASSASAYGRSRPMSAKSGQLLCWC